MFFFTDLKLNPKSLPRKKYGHYEQGACLKDIHVRRYTECLAKEFDNRRIVEANCIKQASHPREIGIWFPARLKKYTANNAHIIFAVKSKKKYSWNKTWIHFVSQTNLIFEFRIFIGRMEKLVNLKLQNNMLNCNLHIFLYKKVCMSKSNPYFYDFTFDYGFFFFFENRWI